jgi:serine protease Do
MKLRRYILTAILALSSATGAHSAPPESFSPIVEPLMPAVVNISTSQKVAQQVGPMFDFEGIPNTPEGEQFKQLFRQFGMMPFGGEMGGMPEREVTSLGSGFVIDASGYIVTNNHVVGKADAITVIFNNNTRLPATIVGRDEKTDLALLKVKPEKPLIAVQFGDSDALRVGDWVIAIGNPFGLGGSVSAGIVSARGRNINAGPFDDFIQTDAAINRGNSGGPLFNTRGEVIGVNSAIFSPTGGNVGIGFAVPSAMAKSVISQLREFGTIHRGWMGVKIEPVSDELANSLGLGKARGALINEVNPGGPADKAGLQAGDVILKIDGREIDEMRKLPRYVAEIKSGKKAELTYWRKGREHSTSLTVGTLPDEKSATPTKGEKPAAKPDAPKVLGMSLIPLSDPLRAQLRIPTKVKGMVIDALDRAGEAAKRGLQPGDVIVEANESTASSAAEVQKALGAAKKAGRDFALLRVYRNGDYLFATVPVK